MSAKLDKACNIALSGHFGENNVGDDILLLALVDGLSKTLNLNQLVIFTADVTKTGALLAREKRNSENIKLVYSGRWGLRQPLLPFWQSLSWLAETVATLKKSDLHLIGPGTIIKDSNRFFVAFWLARAVLSLLLRRSFAFIGIGVGEVKFCHSKLLIRWLLNLAKFITVRDSSSLAELEALRVHTPVMASYPDLSFTCSHSPEKSGAASQIKRIGLNFRKFKVKHFPERVIQSYEKAIMELLRTLPDDVELVFYSFCNESHQSDLEMFAQIEKYSADNHFKLSNYSYANLTELCSNIATCDVFVGTRYHSVLLAIQAGVPTIGLSYEGKTLNFMKDVDLSDFVVDVSIVSSVSLVDVWAKVISEYTRYQNRLSQKRCILGVQSNKHFDAVLGALSHKERNPYMKNLKNS